jgi:copper(I)-binding protein
MMLKFIATKNWKKFITCSIFNLLLIASSVQAHEYETKAFVMEHPFAHPSQPGQTLVPVYLRFLKITDTDKLIGVECRYAHSVELRGSQDLSMPPISEINISASENFEIGPLTHHILLKGISIPFNYLSHYDMKLFFEKAGMIEVTVSVGM